MTETFIASNGREVEVTSTGRVNLYYGVTFGPRTNSLEKYDYLDQADVLALREYFKSKEESVPGMWRSKKDPRYVGFPTETGAVRLVNITTGGTDHYTRRQVGAFPTDPFSAIAAEYFEDNKPPAPAGHKAKVGEVWEITSILGVFVALVSKKDAFNQNGDSLHFVFYRPEVSKNDSYRVTSTAISSARRIHPA